MKLFGGFSGKHFHQGGEENPAAEPEEVSAVQELETGEAPEAEEPIREAEPAEAEENGRTPEEQAEIDEMIRRYQRKKHIRRWIVLGVIVALLAVGYIIYKSTVKPP